ncbi:MAG: chemotaxis protein CheB [Nitrospirales bacterium]
MAKQKTSKSARTAKKSPTLKPVPPTPSLNSGEVDSTQNSSPSLLRIVGIGASAGGLEALQDFFREIPPTTGAAFVVVVHLSPDFKSLMPEILRKYTTMPVLSPPTGTKLEPNQVYIIPPGKNMSLAKQTIYLQKQDRSPGHPLNLPIDLFFRSLAANVQELATAVILSGTGSDGSRGIQEVKEHGGLILVQDPDTAKFGGMPTVAVETRLVDFVASPDKLAQGLLSYFSHASLPILDSQETEQSELHEVLKKITGLDLSYYRPAVVERRLTRRMGMSGHTNLSSYIAFLEQEHDEAKKLVKDLLIGVTNFFRDSEVFETLKSDIFPALLSEKSSTDPLRIWVPACSTGEEVYSLAIMLTELIENMKQDRTFTIFASDIDQESITKASLGQYSMSILAEVSPLRMKKYFSQNGDHYVVNQDLRKHIRFVQHNVLQDNPFSKMDFVSCRNFLIYVQPQSQIDVIGALHFSLKPQGFMLLGPAEAVVGLDGSFEASTVCRQLYRKIGQAHWKNTRTSRSIDPLTLTSMQRYSHLKPPLAEAPEVRQIFDALLAMNNQTVVHFSLEGELLELFEDHHKLFGLPKGKATNHISKMIVPKLHAPLLAGLHRLKKGEPAVMYQVDLDSRRLRFHLSIFSAHTDGPNSVLLVINEEASLEVPMADSSAIPTTWDTKAGEIIRGLEVELQQTKENLQSMIEELQTTNEEQQSTNEELISSNEELQSTNEELKSVNEELYIVNQEFNSKNQELTVLAQDLENLIRATNIGTLYLDQTLTIRKFTPAVTEIIPILSSDVGRPLNDLVHGLNRDVIVDIQTVLDSGESIEREVRDTNGAWILMRCHPYLTKGNMEEGILITFVNVTKLKNAQEFSSVVNKKLEKANHTLVEQSQELEDLFSILAHDLKRPVISLDGLLTILEQSAAQSMEQKNVNYLHKALEECQRMQRLLIDLTKVSIHTRQETVTEDIDLQPFWDAIVERFREQTERLGVRLNVTCDPGEVHAPKTVLEQAAHNLIENAIKYGSSNPKPRIDVTCHVRAHELYFSVIDNGKGIDSANHAKVFELFRRLDPKASEGSGVGLVAVRRQVLKAGGHVDLDSAPGKGAKFTIRIPIPKSADQLTESQYQVLLIEDDPLDRKIAQRCLEEISSYHGRQISLTWARSLADAKELLLRKSIDLVLLDLSLPDGHGLHLLTELRSMNDPPLSVIILSGHGHGIPFATLDDRHVSYLPKADLNSASLYTAMQGVLKESEKISVNN